MVLSPTDILEHLGSGLFKFILGLRFCELASSTKAVPFVSTCFNMTRATLLKGSISGQLVLIFFFCFEVLNSKHTRSSPVPAHTHRLHFSGLHGR